MISVLAVQGNCFKVKECQGVKNKSG